MEKKCEVSSSSWKERKMKKIKSILVLCFLGLIIGGCGKIEIKKTINSDGSGIAEWNMKLTEESKDALKSFIKLAAKQSYQKKGAKIINFDMDFNISIKAIFDDVRKTSSLWEMESDEDEEDTIKFKKLDDGSFEYEEELEIDLSELTNMFGEGKGIGEVFGGNMNVIEFEYTIVLPGKITKTNADSHKGRVATWKITSKKNDITIKAKCGKETEEAKKDFEKYKKLKEKKVKK